jgi:hypothetical protein
MRRLDRGWCDAMTRLALVALGPGSRLARARALAALVRDTQPSRVPDERAGAWRQRAKIRDPGATA